MWLLSVNYLAWCLTNFTINSNKLHLNIYSKKKSELFLVMFFCWLPLMNGMTGSQGKQRRLVCTSHSAFRPHPKMSLILPTFLSDSSRLSLQKKSTYCCVLRCPSPRPQRSTCMSAGKKKKKIKISGNLDDITPHCINAHKHVALAHF